jgi:hypothetical protein
MSRGVVVGDVQGGQHVFLDHESLQLGVCGDVDPLNLVAAYEQEFQFPQAGDVQPAQFVPGGVQSDQSGRLREMSGVFNLLFLEMSGLAGGLSSTSRVSKPSENSGENQAELSAAGVEKDGPSPIGRLITG